MTATPAVNATSRTGLDGPGFAEGKSFAAGFYYRRIEVTKSGVYSGRHYALTPDDVKHFAFKREWVFWILQITWTENTVRTLGLETTLRPRGRPGNQE